MKKTMINFAVFYLYIQILPCFVNNVVKNINHQPLYPTNYGNGNMKNLRLSEFQISLMIINSIQSNKYFRNFEYFMHKGILKKEKKVIK